MNVCVMGIDPGLANMGVGVVALKRLEGEEILSVMVLSTRPEKKKKNVRQSSDLVRRTRELASRLATVVDAYSPRVIAVEAVSYPRNAASAAKTAMSWGVLCSIAERNNIPLVQASPKDIKKAVCGKQTASKIDVQDSLTERYPEAFSVFLASYPKMQHEHGFDAVGSVVACMDSDVIRMARGMVG